MEQKIIVQEANQEIKEQKNNKSEENKIIYFDELPDILTAKILSEFLDLSPRRIYELMDINPEYGGIPCLRIGRSKRVLKSDIKVWLESKRNESNWKEDKEVFSQKGKTDEIYGNII